MALSETELTDYISAARNSPRLTTMYGEFSDLATGRKGAPDNPVILDPDLLGHDALCLRFANVRERHAGVFNQHFIASLPYALEEQCRFGAAILKYSWLINDIQKRPLDLYTLGDASGVTARSLSDISDGKIRTLTCSPNPENQVVFHEGRPGKNAHFFLGPFFEVSPDSLVRHNIDGFESGFDIIVEDTTFQMYGKHRLAPIKIVSKNLREDGIFIFLEKFSHANKEEFFRRENQKDYEFKIRFFSIDKIEEKKVNIVNDMDNNLATLDEFRECIADEFSFAVMIWNTGNFYKIAASNNLENLRNFVRCLTPSAIPDEFNHAALPAIFVGDEDLVFSFRAPSTASTPIRILPD